jgi:exosortase/archaeosortase
LTILRGLIGLIGILAVLMGLLWVGQGLGVIMWPAESFMLADRTWARNGTILALVCLALVWGSRRLGR